MKFPAPSYVEYRPQDYIFLGTHLNVDIYKSTLNHQPLVLVWDDSGNSAWTFGPERVDSFWRDDIPPTELRPILEPLLPEIFAFANLVS